MLNCFNIIDQTDNKNIKDIISLTYDQRFIRRKKVKSDNGIEFLVNLSETKSLNPGQAFELDNLDLIKVHAKVEKLLEIKGNNLMQIIWHIGNRHIPCQIEKDRVLILSLIHISEPTRPY